MDTIQLPTIALPTSFGGAAPALQPGQVIQALVLALLENGSYRLQLPNAVLDVRSQIPLVPGSTVRLAVKGTPAALKLVILPDGATQAPAARPGLQSIVSLPVPHASQSTDMAAPRAGRAPLATQAEATVVNAPPISSAKPLPAIEAPKLAPDPSRPVAPEQALAAAVSRAAARQGGLGPLLANIAHLLEDGRVELPAPVRAAATQLLGLRLAPEGLSVQGLQQAFARSGLLLEGKLAASAPPAIASPSLRTTSPDRPAALAGVPARALPAVSPDMPDLKAALLVFRHVLTAWSASEPMVPTRHSPVPHASEAAATVDVPKPPAGVSPFNGLLDAPDMEDALPAGLAKAVRAALEQSARPPSDPSINPPPPYRGAPTAAQPVAQASLAQAVSDEVTPRETAERLLVQTDAALARQTLLQASSLPERIEPGTRAEGARWNFEIPIATPQGTGVAQFEISRDGHAAPTEATPAAWRARFSLDIEPNGPVHALVTLNGERAGVTLWAERQATAARLSEGAPLLGEALRLAELEPSELQFRVGSPRGAKPAAPGQFMDRAT